MATTFIFTGFNGVKWTARLVFRGDGFGMILEDGSYIYTHDESEPMVEFYDRRQDPKRFTEYGQFVNRYYLSTLMERKGCGLNLQDGVDDWALRATDMDYVRRRIADTLEEINLAA